MSLLNQSDRSALSGALIRVDISPSAPAEFGLQARFRETVLRAVRRERDDIAELDGHRNGDVVSAFQKV